MKLEDYIAITVIILVALKVSLKGFIAEFSSKSGLVFGAFFVLMFLTPFSSIIDNYFNLGKVSNLIALILLFFIGYVCARFLLSVIDDLFILLHLRVLDHILGFALGAAEGAIILMVAFYLLQLQTFFNIENISNSFIMSYLKPYIPIFFNKISEVFA